MTASEKEGAEFGVLIVGLGGNNGVTMLAGIRANQLGLEWESATGKVKANYLGCITQLPSKGGKGGYRERYALGNVNKCAIGGWDIRPTPLGDALYESHVLDYDLVKQVREWMNTSVETIPGVWSPSFIGESQHATATHAVKAATQKERLEVLRGDIRRFKSTHQVRGHVTVIWSASVERPCMKEFNTAHDFLSAIDNDDAEVSPSLLYAAAAALEGCSFVNGGSQNTLCPALDELAARHGAYVLGTDFKAGQTKFKTAAVEYIRALGLKPVVMASSNHLGNNDMLNLTSKKTLDAKMRVKSDIFAGWGEDIDHQVRVMYTPLIGDEKRDIVEYTSLGFLNCAHTMLTYTRCMDSILCVPLMIDVAVWCDYFARCRTDPKTVSAATAYLFKVPEGGAKGVDPGFFHQMKLLEDALESTLQCGSLRPLVARPTDEKGRLPGAVVCCGLSCLDLMLVGASGTGKDFGAINPFRQQVFCPGGSAAQSSLALGHMGADVVIVTKMGRDVHGDELLRLLADGGVSTSSVIRDAEQSTSLAVLPILATGERGCYVNLQANDSFTPSEALNALQCLVTSHRTIAAVHFGYPHLMAHFRGPELASFFTSIHKLFPPTARPLVSMDLNGVPETDAMSALRDALPHTDLLHLNANEACLLTGVDVSEEEGLRNLPALRNAAEVLLSAGVGVVTITLGAAGAYAAVNADVTRFDGGGRAALQAREWVGQEATLPPPVVDGEVNSNGAGDAFVAGMVAAMIVEGVQLSLKQALLLAMLTARERVDSKRRDRHDKVAFAQLLAQAMEE